MVEAEENELLFKGGGNKRINNERLQSELITVTNGPGIRA